MKRLLLTLSLAAIAVPAGAADDIDSPAAQVADLLARIDQQAARHGKRRAIADSLRALDRLGARPADGAENPVPAWRKTAGIGEPDYRGRVLGPAYSRGWIEPGQTARIDQQFLAGQRATVAVAAAPQGGLALSVTDPDRALVCRTQPRSCNWLPLYTQRYTITLSNRGTSRLRYYLVVD